MNEQHFIRQLGEKPFSEAVCFAHQIRDEIMAAIRNADLDSVREKNNIIDLLMKYCDIGLLSRCEDTIRSLKNILLSYNTLYSYSAELGGLNPLSSHYKAERYAILIEKAETIRQLWNIYYEYSEDYADPENRTFSRPGEPLSVQVIRYIQKNFTNKLSIEMIADEFHINSSYLMRKFKKDTGHTIQQVITEKRINEACRLLAFSSLNITEISYIVGFNSSSYFSQVFKHTLDISPKEYREHRKKSLYS